MKLISKVKIEEFRSIQDSKESLDMFGNFNAFVGLNNSGKSNVLRALNAFFTGVTDAGCPISFMTDYNKFDLHKKKRNKAVEISVEFSLPSNFRFRDKLQDVEQYLGRDFTITKRWYRNQSTPDYFLNEQEKPEGLENRQKIDLFLSLINFRYIPNRVLPVDIIKNEHQALRDVLVRRLGRKAKTSRKTFDEIQEISSHLIEHLAQRLQRMNVGASNLRLATPKDWADMIFAFGYRLGDGKIEIEDSAQGSGIQSLLMLETLYLIDKDYFQQFGWRQASVWAIEEPESSLHSTLEAQVASFLREISTMDTNRLQIIATTHSELVLQYADKGFFVDQTNKETIFDGNFSVKDILRKSSQVGASKYLHPIIHYPLEPFFLVDGKYDVPFVQKAISFIVPKSNVKIFSLEQIQEGKTGGTDLLKYLKESKQAILCRDNNAPIIALIDWEDKTFNSYMSLSQETQNKLMVFQWPSDKANPKISKNFRGLERFYSDRLINIADKKEPGKIGKTTNGKYTIHSDDYGAIKKILYEEINLNGIKEEDIQFAKPFLDEVLAKLKLL